MNAAACAFHRRRAGVTTCALCRRRLCRACIVPTPVGLKCAHCAQRPAAGRGRRRRSHGRGAAVVAVATVTAAAVAALALFVAALRDPSGELGIQGAAIARAAGSHSADVQIPERQGRVLRAALQTPPVGGAAPAALIVPRRGSDRDGPVGRDGAVDPFYRDMADALTRQGFAVLRYDGRDPRPGAAGSDAAARARARSAMKFLRERAETAGPPIVVAHADAAGTAIALAGERSAVAGLVLLSPGGSSPKRADVDAPVLLAGGDAPLRRWRERLSATASIDVLRVPSAGSTLLLGDEPGARDRVALHRVARWARGAVHAAAGEPEGHEPMAGPSGARGGH